MTEVARKISIRRRRASLALAAAFASFAALGVPSPAEALQYARAATGDPRIARYKYEPDEVYGLLVAPLKITYIEFPRGERVQSIGAGDTESYQFHRLEAGNVVTVKPALGGPSQTNVTIITNRRTYSFTIMPRSSGGYYRVSFDYPPEPEEAKGAGTFNELTEGTTPTGVQLNTSYSRSGEAEFAPAGMWDDGVHTWIRFDPNQPRPAVFRVGPNGFEETVNVTQHPNHLIQVHGLAPAWTLRIGAQSICVRNEVMAFVDAPATAERREAAGDPPIKARSRGDR